MPGLVPVPRLATTLATRVHTTNTGQELLCRNKRAAIPAAQQHELANPLQSSGGDCGGEGVAGGVCGVGGAAGVVGGGEGGGGEGGGEDAAGPQLRKSPGREGTQRGA